MVWIQFIVAKTEAGLGECQERVTGLRDLAKSREHRESRASQPQRSRTHGIYRARETHRRDLFDR